jgi:quercetin dioxygenase-like cupin family protein
MRFYTKSIFQCYPRGVKAVAFSFFGIAIAAIAADTASLPIVTAFSEIKFPEKSFQMGKTSIKGAVLREEASGRVVVLTKQMKGATNKHYHTINEDVFMLSGTLVHYAPSLPGATEKKLGAGSYWYVPAGSVHQDTCLTDECVYFVVVDGKGETKVVGDAP